jgi:UvrD-like helicase C-terminal domain
MLVPAYAATIHKSQGSEYPAVVIPIMTQHYAMLQRNLLYTGVTRGKRLVVLVGQKKAIAIAVRNVSGRRRWSKLQEWLRPNPSLSRQIGHGELSHGAVESYLLGQRDGFPARSGGRASMSVKRPKQDAKLLLLRKSKAPNIRLTR